MASVLMDGDDPTMRVIELLALRLERMARKNWVLSIMDPPVGYLGKTTVFDGPAPPETGYLGKTTVFHGPAAPYTKQLDPLLDYLQHFQLEIECLPSDYVLAGIYVERFLRANPSVPITYSNVHRLVLAALTFTVRFYKIYLTNGRFAAAGEVTTKEVSDIVEALSSGIDLDSYDVDAEAFDEYCALLLREEEEEEEEEEAESRSASSPSHWARPALYMTPFSAPREEEEEEEEAELRSASPPSHWARRALYMTPFSAPREEEEEEEEAELRSASPPSHWARPSLYMTPFSAPREEEEEEEEAELRSASPPSHWARPALYMTPVSAAPSSHSAPSSSSHSAPPSASMTTAPRPTADDSCFVCKFCGKLNSSSSSSTTTQLPQLRPSSPTYVKYHST